MMIFGFLFSLFSSYPHLVEKLVVMNASHPIAFRQELSVAQMFRSWYMFFYQTPFLPEKMLQADDFAFLSSVFQKKPSGLVNHEMITNDDIEVYKYTFSQEGKLNCSKNSSMSDEFHFYRNNQGGN